jgi:hypothetical protein
LKAALTGYARTANEMTDETPPKEEDALASLSAEEIIECFGGIRPMAAKLGVPVTTVQGWKSRGRIPANRRSAIREAAAAHNIDLAAPVSGKAKEPVTISSVPVSVAVEESEDGTKEDKTPEEAAPAAAETEPAPEHAADAETESVADKSDHAEHADALDEGENSGFKWKAFVFVLLLLAAVGVAVYWTVPRPNAPTPLPNTPSTPASPAPSESGDAAPATPEQAAPETPTNTPAQQPLETPAKAPAEAEAKPERPAPETAPETAKKTAPEQAGAGAGKAPAAAPAPDRSAELAAAQRAVSEKTKALGEQLSALADRANKLGAEDQALAAKMNQQVAEIREQIAALRSALGDMQGKLQKAGQPRATGSARIALHALLLGQLEAEINAGRPYRAPLDRFRGAVQAPEVGKLLAALDSRADSGIPNRAELEKRFRVLLRELALTPAEPALAPDAAAEPGETFLGWLRARLKGLVSVRRVAGPGPLPPLSKAEAAVMAGDLVKAAGILDAAGAAKAKVWIADVRAHAAAEETLAKLRLHIGAALEKAAGVGKAR